MKELVLAVILSFARGPIANEVTYLERVAEDIASVVQDEDAPHAFDGPAAKEATAVLLVAIAAHESGFAHDVDDCRRRGDSGRSRTMWQIMGTVFLEGHTTTEICKDRRLAAKLALHIVAKTWAKNRNGAPQRLVNAYASGQFGIESRAAMDICNMWQTRAKRLGLRGASCWRRNLITLPEDADAATPSASPNPERASPSPERASLNPERATLSFERPSRSDILIHQHARGAPRTGAIPLGAISSRSCEFARPPYRSALYWSPPRAA
jgi:hypothetical protein